MALARTTLEHLKGFADDGLRTLAVAKREVGEEEYADWKVRFDAALEDPSEIAKKRSSEDNRIDQLMDEMEKELHLVGATALEDKLQVWNRDTYVHFSTLVSIHYCTAVEPRAYIFVHDSTTIRA